MQAALQVISFQRELLGAIQQRWVSPQRYFNYIGTCLRVVCRHKKPSAAVDHKIRHASNRSSHYGHAGSHRLDYCHWGTFIQRCVYHHV
jgi:hypothetical protein